MNNFKVGQKVQRVKYHATFKLFRDDVDAVFTVSETTRNGNIRLNECPDNFLYEGYYFELYQEPTQKTFNPKPGDTIVTEGEGNWTCCTVEDLNNLKKINFSTTKPIIGYRMSGERIGGHQDWDEYGNADGVSSYSIKAIIPNNPVRTPQQPQDLSFQVKALELENQMLRVLLRREGVEV